MPSIEDVLKKSKNIAIVGLSNDPNRPSYQVARYFLSEGFNIIPVNPTINSVFGLKSYSDLSSIPQNIKIDIVDVFRKSEALLSLVEEIIKLKIKPVLWFQEGVFNSEAEILAKENGLEVFSNICLMKIHQKS